MKRVTGLILAMALFLSSCNSGNLTGVASNVESSGNTSGISSAFSSTVSSDVESAVSTASQTAVSTPSKAAVSTTSKSLVSTTSKSLVSATSQSGSTMTVGDKVEIGGKRWEVTFVDDFNDTHLDSKNWSYCPAWKRQDVENYWNRKEVTFPGNGSVSIGIENDKENNRILSGAIWTANTFKQAYGYYEVRCRLQQAVGCWSAFWLMCDNMGSIGNGGVDGAEIDIMESPFLNRGSVQHNIHWDGYAEAKQSDSSGDITRAGLYSDFHTYALEWTKDAYIFYIDGKETFRSNKGGICAVPCYLILSVEAGSWGGKIIDEQLPTAFLVDYVRVYKACS